MLHNNSTVLCDSDDCYVRFDLRDEIWIYDVISESSKAGWTHPNEDGLLNDYCPECSEHRRLCNE